MTTNRPVQERLTHESILQATLSRLRDVEQITDSGYRAFCPSHVDQEPGLTLCDMADSIWIHCQQCSLADILGALELGEHEPHFERRPSLLWSPREISDSDEHVNLAPVVQVVRDPTPIGLAEFFLNKVGRDNEGRATLRRWKGFFMAYTDGAYREVDAEHTAALIYRVFDGVKKQRLKDGKRELVAIVPNKNLVSEVKAAIPSRGTLVTSDPPCWLDEQDGHEPRDLIVCKNGILHVPSRELMAPSPSFFTTAAVDFDYRFDAPAPKEWLRFLMSIWEGDPDSVSCLQEIMGYLLTLDTSQQKVFVLVGPTRSGKGTIGSVLKKLLGEANVCAPTLSSLAVGDFGLSPLLGKPLALIGDAHLSRKADPASVVERLKIISGEDPITINIKYRDPLTTVLPTRFFIMTNSMPRMSDPSGALSARLLVLRMTRTFLGKEDLSLRDRLAVELPGIFNWALAGLDRLRARGHFLQTESGQELLDEISEDVSPILAFVREACVINTDATVAVQELYKAWCRWCEDQGREHVGTIQSFGIAMRAAVPGLIRKKPTIDGKRVPTYHGIGLAGDGTPGDAAEDDPPF